MERIVTTNEEVLVKKDIKLKRPSRYKVIMHNDDFTTMEFVIHVLYKVFNKPISEANRVMLYVHNKGLAICGVYTYEIAETKISVVSNLAQSEGHPLKCTMEQE